MLLNQIGKSYMSITQHTNGKICISTNQKIYLDQLKRVNIQILKQLKILEINFEFLNKSKNIVRY